MFIFQRAMFRIKSDEQYIVKYFKVIVQTV